MRIIVADDMPVQVREISNGIHANWPQWEVLTAGDGEEIVRLVSSKRIDIVLSDIRMPRMDGLEMLSVVRQISPKTKIVFITAYPLFEYAQKALKLGAVDFLLKPVDPTALYDLLARLSSEDSQVGYLGEELREWLKRDWSELAPAAQAHIRECLARGGVICSIAAPATDAFPLPRHLAEDISATTGCTVLGADMFSTAEVRRYALICAEDKYRCDQFSQALSTAAMRYGFRAGISEWCGDLPESGHRRWSEACHGEEQAFYSSACVICSRTPYTAGTVELPYVQKVLSWFGDQEGWKPQLKRLLEDIGQKMPASEELIRYTRQILRDCAKRLTREGEETAQVGEALKLVVFFREYCVCVETAMSALEALYRSSIEHADPVELAMDYVRKHYMESIALSDVAEMTHLSPNYFSTLFRKRTSMRFMEYVLQVRLEKASEMLANTDMYVYEIANACGYEDVRYFVRVYQKAYGISPANFRRFFRKDKPGE